MTVVIQPEQPKSLYEKEKGRLYRDLGIEAAGVAAFALLLPHSMPLAIAAGAAVTVGTIYNHTKEEKVNAEQQWDAILKKYWDDNYKNVEQALMEQIQKQYDYMLEFLNQKYEQELQSRRAALTVEDTTAKRAELEKLLDQARRIGEA